jgi:hypothetical protein
MPRQIRFALSLKIRQIYSTRFLAAAIDAFQTSITVASSAAAPPTPFDMSVCNAGESGETMTVSAVAGTTVPAPHPASTPPYPSVLGEFTHPGSTRFFRRA